MRIPATLRSLPAALASFILLASLPTTQAENPPASLVVLHPTEPNPPWLQAFQPLRERMQIEFRATDGSDLSSEGHAFILVPTSAGAAAQAPSSNRRVPLPEDVQDLRDLCHSAAAILAAIETHLAKAPAQKRKAN